MSEKKMKLIKILYLDDCIRSYYSDKYDIDYNNRTIEIDGDGKSDFLQCDETETTIYVRIK